MNDSLAHDLRRKEREDMEDQIAYDQDQERKHIAVNDSIHHAMYSVAGMHDFLSANWDNLDLARALVNLCQYCTNSTSANAPAVLHAVERRIYSIAKQEAESCS